MAQTPSGAPAPSVQAQSYAEFALGKWAELQARSNPGSKTNFNAQALEHFRAALQNDPGSAYLASQIADLLSRMGRGSEAVALARSTVARHPTSLDAHEALANIYLRELSQARPPLAGADETALLRQTVSEYEKLIQLDPADPDHLVMLGRLYGASGRPADADREFRAALALAPTNMEALASLVQSLARQHRLDLAQAEIASLPPVARSGPVYATLGEAYLNAHRNAEAAAAFRRAVNADPDDPDYQNALAQALMDEGDYAHALIEFQRLQKQVPDNGRAALRVAQMQLQMGQLSAAAASLKTARALLPSGDLEVNYASALLDQSQGRDRQALAKLQALADRKTNPETQSIFLTQLAHLQIRTGDFAAASTRLQQLQALGAPYAAGAQVLEIELYTRQRDYPRALTLTRTVLKAQPNSRNLHLTYANLLAASGQPAAAESEIQSLLQGNSGDAQLYLALARIHLSQREWPQATADAHRADALALTTAAHVAAREQLGAIAAAQSNFDAAEREYRQALALDPGDPTTLNALGYALAQQGAQLPQALDYVQQALARDHDNSAYLDSLGWVFFKMNRLPEAVASLQRAARLQSNDPEILDHLAQAYERSGALRQAEASWREARAALKRDPAPSPRLSASIEQGLDRVRTKLKN